MDSAHNRTTGPLTQINFAVAQIAAFQAAFARLPDSAALTLKYVCWMVLLASSPRKACGRSYE